MSPLTRLAFCDLILGFPNISPYLHLQVKYNTIEYWHKIYAENMEQFFAIFDSLTEGVTIGQWSKED